MLNAINPFSMDADMAAAAKVAEGEIKKHTGKDITVTVSSCPSEWKEWMRKTGMNSLCTDQTWDFLEKSPANARRVELWGKRDIKKITMKMEMDPPDDVKSWKNLFLDWEDGSDEVTIRWCVPNCKKWDSKFTWSEHGYKNWWILNDMFTFGLQIHQLPGKCFYKSDWLEGIEDPDPESPLPWSTKKYKRWFQFRHWILYWYAAATPGWNHVDTDKPPKLPDGSDFDLSAVLSLPSMPDFKMPAVTLPSLPGMPSMPSLPSLPSLSAPSLSMPSLSAPSINLSAPSLPSFPSKPKRPTKRYDLHGIIEMGGMKVASKGSKLVLSNITVTHLWEEPNGSIRNEKKDKQKMELECMNSEQAESWVKSLIGGGAEEGDASGCCSIA